jgi:8-oxo-dGTP diphosphatase
MLAEALFYEGPNPTVDLAIFSRRRSRIFLIRRRYDPYRGLWALAGGFQNTMAPPGGLWKPGLESAAEAARREAREETGLDIHFRLYCVGVYEGGGRDPRDTDKAWTRSTAFCVEIPEQFGEAAAGSDASEVGWYDITDLPPLAFDHARIISDALTILPAISP